MSTAQLLLIAGAYALAFWTVAACSSIGLWLWRGVVYVASTR